MTKLNLKFIFLIYFCIIFVSLLLWLASIYPTILCIVKCCPISIDIFNVSFFLLFSISFCLYLLIHYVGSAMKNIIPGLLTYRALFINRIVYLLYRQPFLNTDNPTHHIIGPPQFPKVVTNVRYIIQGGAL